MTPSKTYSVLITGASSGIGRETALAFADEGSRVALAARSDEALHEVASECRRRGAADVLVRATDISDRVQVEQLFAQAVAQFGELDVVVQNASVAAFGRFVDVPADVFDMVIKINVVGASNVARTTLKCFHEGGGHGQLVIVGSVLGHATVPYMGHYVMSKFAMTALIRLLRQETREQRGITIHGIYPGAIDTPIYPLAANYFGRIARVLPLKDPPSKIAHSIVAAVDRGTPSERQVGLANRPLLAGYRMLPRLFDKLAGPLLRAGGFTREAREPTAGNAFEPAHPS
jgi:NAD(P)-dependent dehydrogenase (short-subunit alcohol dehydrogenase family)